MPRPMRKYKTEKEPQKKPGFYPLHEGSKYEVWWEQGRYFFLIKQYANKTQAREKTKKITASTGIPCSIGSEYPFIIFKDEVTK